jgi:hypothetical protein
MIEFVREITRNAPNTACTVRDTRTGRYYLISTLPSETAAFKSDDGYEHSDYITIVRGRHRCDTIAKLERYLSR